MKCKEVFLMLLHALDKIHFPSPRCEDFFSAIDCDDTRGGDSMDDASDD